MNIKNLLYLVSALALATTTAQAQSLTDLAKAEKARRAKLQKASGPTKVYTEADQSGGGAAQPASAATTGSTGTTPASASGKKDKTPEEQAAEAQKEWNDKVKQAEDQIKDLQAGITTKERNLASLINITPARVDLANSIEADKKKLVELQQQLVNLEDQRRRAGMPRPR
jgi:chromosome segregation ATPase